MCGEWSVGGLCLDVLTQRHEGSCQDCAIFDLGVVRRLGRAPHHDVATMLAHPCMGGWEVVGWVCAWRGGREVGLVDARDADGQKRDAIDSLLCHGTLKPLNAYLGDVDISGKAELGPNGKYQEHQSRSDSSAGGARATHMQERVSTPLPQRTLLR